MHVRRSGARLGSHYNGGDIRKRTMVHNDGASRQGEVPEARRRSDGSLPHPRHRRRPRRHPHGLLRGAEALPPLLHGSGLAEIHRPGLRPPDGSKLRRVSADGDSVGRHSLCGLVERRHDELDLLVHTVNGPFKVERR